MLATIETAEKIGSIIIPEKARCPTNQGRIVAVGDTVPIHTKQFEEENPFALGNIVVFPLYSDSSIEVVEEDPKHADRKIRVKYIIVDYTQVICSDYGYFASLQEK